MTPRTTLGLVLTLTALQVQAEQKILSPDGRELILHQDGTWEYASEDIFVPTPAGQTVRLRPDYTWEYMGNAPVRADHQHRELDLDIQLGETVITETVSSAGASRNLRRSARLNFYIDLRLSASAGRSLYLSQLQPENIAVTDDRGKSYQVNQVEPSTSVLNAGDTGTVLIVTTSAPSLLYAPRELYLEISRDALGTQDSIRLTRLYAEIERTRHTE